MPTLTTLSPTARGAGSPGTIQPWRSLASLGIDPTPLETGPASHLENGHNTPSDQVPGAAAAPAGGLDSGLRMPGFTPFPAPVLSPASTGNPGLREA
ncbi:hypothetical protein [Streptomyces albipurpureus]|uniref:Uncharacterized protein n=1 Tax=Streptomyces albipurpureus TaxID=2897419 RepID=A0ABT0V0H7_9ACTN|nr:hypothetical protein [Streptomyces sp. CWNU-1]MCM2393815.1 hypothetical protein [Streptomyces sp. CWNU-1]